MVKRIYWLIVLSCSATSYAQNISLGVGGSIILNQTAQDNHLRFDVFDGLGDTLLLQINSSEMEPIYSLPLYVRYNSRKNWWLQLGYGFEYWRLNLNGQTMHTKHFITTAALHRTALSWSNYQGTDFTNYQAYRDAFFPIFLADEQANQTTAFKSFNGLQYNKFSLNFGSALFQKSKVKMVYSLGVDFITKSTSESYRGLAYDDPDIIENYEILKALPSLVEFNFVPFATLGLERQNLRVGLDIHLSPRPAVSVFEDSNPQIISQNNNTDPTISSLLQYGLHVNYALFSQYLNKNENKEKVRTLNPEILGKYVEIPKLWQLGFTVDFIGLFNSGFTNLGGYTLSQADQEQIDQELKANADGYLSGTFIIDPEVQDYLYIEKHKRDFIVNDLGNIDTNDVFKTLFFAWGNINTIIKSPKVTGFVTYSPFNHLAFEMGAGYRRQTLGLESYEKTTIRTSTGIMENTNELLYQETFHEASVGLRLIATKKIDHSSKIGLQLGVNYNAWIPARFRQETGGANDSELLEDFHNYFVLGKETGTWNANLNPGADKGVFSKQDYYNHQYVPGSDISQQFTYHTDFSDHLFNTVKQRSFFDLRLGLDYYIEKWRFTIYGEQSLGQVSLLYDNFLTLGMAFSFYVN